MDAGGSEMGFLRWAWLHAIVMRRRGAALVVGPGPLRDAPVLREGALGIQSLAASTPIGRALDATRPGSRQLGG
jgi:hypothetical protein